MLGLALKRPSCNAHGIGPSKISRRGNQGSISITMSHFRPLIESDKCRVAPYLAVGAFLAAAWLAPLGPFRTMPDAPPTIITAPPPLRIGGADWPPAGS